MTNKVKTSNDITQDNNNSSASSKLSSVGLFKHRKTIEELDASVIDDLARDAKLGDWFVKGGWAYRF